MTTSNSQTQPRTGGLYITATPIGNLTDMSFRAVEVLKSVDIIACEDTRTSSVLLSHYGIKKPLLPYHEHNAAQARPKILQALAEGKSVALISDAGTPLISDPGYKLVKDAHAQGFSVFTVPGASSIIAALSIAGLPTDRFFYAGFLPAKTAACRSAVEALAAIPATLVFLESPHRICATLGVLADVLGEREAVVARELTKKFEETRRGMLAELHAFYTESGDPKGEIVLLVAPPEQEIPQSALETDKTLKLALEYLSVKDAASFTSKLLGLKKNEIYARALELSSNG